MQEKSQGIFNFEVHVFVDSMCNFCILTLFCTSVLNSIILGDFDKFVGIVYINDDVIYKYR
jgi:hypothetical protein